MGPFCDSTFGLIFATIHIYVIAYEQFISSGCAWFDVHCWSVCVCVFETAVHKHLKFCLIKVSHRRVAEDFFFWSAVSAFLLGFTLAELFSSTVEFTIKGSKLYYAAVVLVLWYLLDKIEPGFHCWLITKNHKLLWSVFTSRCCQLSFNGQNFSDFFFFFLSEELYYLISRLLQIRHIDTQIGLGQRCCLTSTHQESTSI